VHSKTADGCRRVQDALKSALMPDQKAMAHELRGHVCELLESPHGNHVLQLVVELLPPDAVDFVRSEILQRWSAADLAQQPYGCRVLERLIEHFPGDRLEGAVRDILCKVETLSADQYGNFVIQHLLEHGDEGQRRRIADVVRSNAAHFVNGVSACGVLDKALTYGSWHDQVDIARRIVEQEPLLATMAASAHGFASTQRLFTIAAHARERPAAAGGDLLEAACRQLLEQPTLERMMASRHGQSLLSEVIPPGYGGAPGALARSRPGVGRDRG
jgi:mRNA-binding protein PUF3